MQPDPFLVLNIAGGIVAAKMGVSPLSAIGLGLAIDLLSAKTRSAAVTDLAIYFAAYGVGIAHEAARKSLR